MYVVDASVWASYYIPDDVFYPLSRQWLRQQVEALEVLAAPAILLAEVGGAVSRRTGNSQQGSHALSLMQKLPNLHVLEIDAAFAQSGARLAAEYRLRGADALYVALAYSLGIPLVTWDREQRGRSVPSVSSLTPQEALSRP